MAANHENVSWNVACASTLICTARFPVTGGNLQIDPKLKEFIEDEDILGLNGSPNTIYAIWSDLTIAYLNDAWFNFARSNQAGADFFERFGVGSSIDFAGENPANRRFIESIRASLADKKARVSYYECPSPQSYRLMQVTFLPISGDVCIVSNADVVITSHVEAGRAPGYGPVAEYMNQDGMVAMCSSCRRVRDPDSAGAWVFVPAFVENPVDRVSHTLCESCNTWWLSPAASPVQLEVADLTRELSG